MSRSRTIAAALTLSHLLEPTPMRVLDPNRGQHILHTAARLFDRRRYHEVRMEDVAASAGVGKGTLYRYFQDKEDLYIALLVSAIERFCQEMNAALKEAAS